MWLAPIVKFSDDFPAITYQAISSLERIQVGQMSLALGGCGFEKNVSRSRADERN
jgi:hypothetical protein